MLHRSISYGFIGGLSAVALAVLLFAVGPATDAGAQTAPGLGAASSYAVLGGQTVTNTGPTTIGGDVGVSPGTAVTGFPPAILTGGAIHSADANALQAQGAVSTAYNALAAQPCTADLTGQDLGGMTLTEGVYCFSSSAQLTGLLTLNAQASASAVFIFKAVSTLTTASNSSVLVTNDSTGCNVFWQVGSSATIGTGTVFVGNILALTSIALNTGASVSGRVLARNGEVTMDTNHVGFSGCAAPTATASPTASPTASAYRDAITNNHRCTNRYSDSYHHPDSSRDSYADGNPRGTDAHTCWPDANADSYSHAGWADANGPHHALLPAALRRALFAGWSASLDSASGWAGGQQPRLLCAGTGRLGSPPPRSAVGAIAPT